MIVEGKKIMIRKDEEKIFLEYFNKEKLDSKECVKNYKNRKIIFKIKIEDQWYYIKKYVPYRMREKAMALGLQRDRAKHYEFISKKMKKLGIKHVEPYYTKVRRYSFFKRASILVTKDGGISLENYVKDFKNHKEWFKYFFDTYVYLAKNGVYCTDYNPDGMLVNENGELLLIDFDAFKTKIYLTNKYKEYLIECLRRIYSDIKREEEFIEYSEEEIQRVIRELKWKIK